MSLASLNVCWNKSFVDHRLEMKSTMAFLQMNMIEILLFSPHWINLIKSHEKWRRGWSAASAFICAWIASLILFSSDRFPLHRLELTFHYRLSWESRQKCERKPFHQSPSYLMSNLIVFSKILMLFINRLIN